MLVHFGAVDHRAHGLVRRPAGRRARRRADPVHRRRHRGDRRRRARTSTSSWSGPRTTRTPCTSPAASRTGGRSRTASGTSAPPGSGSRSGSRSSRPTTSSTSRGRPTRRPASCTGRSRWRRHRPVPSPLEVTLSLGRRGPGRGSRCVVRGATPSSTSSYRRCATARTAPACCGPRRTPTSSTPRSCSGTGSPGESVDRSPATWGCARSAVGGGSFTLNGQPYYTRSVLNQGYRPETHLASRGSDELRAEVELIKAMGFNAVRVHQKAEDPRFLYWADRLGLLVWGETAGAYEFSPRRGRPADHASGWSSCRRYRSHPSVVVWVPINESWGVQDIATSPAQQQFAQSLVSLTRALDPSRPAVSNEGWEHVDSDILGMHDYTVGARPAARPLRRQGVGGRRCPGGARTAGPAARPQRRAGAAVPRRRRTADGHRVRRHLAVGRARSPGATSGSARPRSTPRC